MDKTNIKRKKIFIISQPQVTNTVGGAISVFVNISNMLSDNGYDIYTICSNKTVGKPDNLSPNIEFINLQQKYNNLNFSQAISKELEINTPDLIIFFFHYLYIDAKLSKKYENIPRILMFHSRPDFYFSILPNSKEELKSVYTNTTAQVLFDSFKSLLPDYIQQGQTVTIPNSITSQDKIIDTKVEQKKIIYLSRIDYFKGLEFLIYSFKLIANNHKDWTLDIWGQSEPPDYVDELNNLINKLKLNKQIRFKGITKKPMETFLKYDFCVFPSFFEGWGLGLTEAMSVGLPCIGLKECSAVNELIIDGYNGYLAKENYKDFAMKIEKLIKDKSLREQFSKNAIASTQKYNKKIVDKMWLDTIERIINNLPMENNSGNTTDFPPLFPINKIVNMSIRGNYTKTRWYQKIFSIKNVGIHKVITILGIKLKIKSQKLIDRIRIQELENQYNILNSKYKNAKNELNTQAEQFNELNAEYNNTKNELNIKIKQFNILEKEYNEYKESQIIDKLEADKVRGEIYRYQIDMNSDDPKVYILNQIKENSKVLDVGCACGDFGIKLKELKNSEIIGLEYNSQSIEVAKQTSSYKDVIQCDLNKYKNIPLSNEEFDYIVCGDVLEHIYEPQKVLEYFKQYLKDDGYFLLSIPNISHASIKANLLLDNFDYTPWGLLDQTHIRFFTYKTIVAFLSDLNLEIEDCKLTNFWGINGSQPNNPYPELPQEIREFILKDKHSSIIQYVVKCRKSEKQDLMNINSEKIQTELNNTPYMQGVEEYLK